MVARRRLEHGHGHLGQRPGHGRDVHRLEVLFVQPGHRGLPGDAQDRHGIG
jgi:hypothetical protein